MRFERGEMNAHRRGTDRRCVCSTGGQLVAAHAPAFRVMVRFQVGWRARAGCAVAWDVLRARESTVDAGVCVSRGLQTGGQLVAAHVAAFRVMVRLPVDGLPGQDRATRDRDYWCAMDETVTRGGVHPRGGCEMIPAYAGLYTNHIV